jgi:hypothetical protein
MALLLFGYCFDTSWVVTASRSRDPCPPADTRRVDACTFYLVFKEPAFPDSRVSPECRPPDSYFVVRGTLQSYDSYRSLSTDFCDFFLLTRKIFFAGRSPDRLEFLFLTSCEVNLLGRTKQRAQDL